MNNKITEMEKQKLNDSIESKYPTSYTNNAYGKLSELYDTFNSLNYNSLSDAAKTSMSNDIDDCINDIIAYIENTRIRPENFELIKYWIKSIYATKLGIDIFTDAERNRIEISNSFDFELEKPNDNQLILITNAYDKILVAIDEVKNYLPNSKSLPANKNENKVSQKRGRKPKTTKDFKEYIIKEWNDNGKNLFKDKLKQELKFVKENYNNGTKETLNFTALALIDLKILKANISNKELFEATGNLIIGEKPETQANFDITKDKGIKSHNGNKAYIDIKKRINDITNNINFHYSEFDGL